MSKYNKGQSDSSDSQDEADTITKEIQKPSQTKDQSKLISQGIQKGIELYKKKENAKHREYDENQKQLKKQSNLSVDVEIEKIVKVQARMPWVLLIITWIGISIGAGIYSFNQLGV